MPNTPTIAESGYPTVVSQAWWGLFAPGGTPPELIERVRDLRDDLERVGDRHASAIARPADQLGERHPVDPLHRDESHRDEDQVDPDLATVADRERAPNLPIIKELKITCDFEGEVTWVLGVSSPNRSADLGIVQIIPEHAQTDPATAEKLARAMQALSSVMLDMKVGEMQAAMEGRKPTRAERRGTGVTVRATASTHSVSSRRVTHGMPWK